jgi:hypothetical protein
MKKIYKWFIDFLVKYYTGIIKWKIGKYNFSAFKPTILIFLIFYGILKIIQVATQGEVYFAWWDIVMLILLIPQVLAGFTKFAINEQRRLNGLPKEKTNQEILDEILKKENGGL